MVDIPTLAAYDSRPGEFADRWEAEPPATDLHEIIHRFFTPGPTAEIGCGSGRDAAWLMQEGFPTIAFEPSAGLRDEARQRYPALRVEPKALPELEGVPDGSFVNVLCETVIMHLPREAIGPSVRRLLSLLEPNGTLYLSWRVTREHDQRDEHGRLYTAFDRNIVEAELRGATIMLNDEAVSESSGKVIHRIVARRNASSIEA